MATGMATGNPAIVHSHGEMFLKWKASLNNDTRYG
jgi:hypothetical protein